VLLLALKIVVVPALIVSVTLAGRRWGQRVGGVLASFPLVAGPVLIFFAVEQGDAFASDAARPTLVSLVAVVMFSVVYAWACLRTPWWASLGLAWLGFGVAIVGLHSRLRWTVAGAVIVASASLTVGKLVLPARRPAGAGGPAPAWDLPLRIITTVGLVLTTTALAHRLGPAWSGALTPFPVALAILLGFLHAQQGAPSIIRFLHAFFPGMYSFVAFLLVVAVTVARLGAWVGFVLAFASVIPIQLGLLWWMKRSAA
jgi:hypothetical protein